MSRNSFVEHYGIGRVEIVEVDEEDSDEYDEDDLGIAMRRDEHINMESIQRIINGVVPPRHEDEEEEEEDEERELRNKEVENEKEETENCIVESDGRSFNTDKGDKGLEIIVYEGRNLEISEKPLEKIEVSGRIVEEKQNEDTSEEGELIIDDNSHSSQVDSEDEELQRGFSLETTETFQNVEIEEISEHESDAERMCDDDFRQFCTIGEAICNVLEMDVETESNPNNEVSNKETSFSLLDRSDDKITSDCIKDVEMNYEETIGCLDVNLEKHISHVEMQLSPGEERIACMSAASASENNEMETEKSLDCESLSEKIVDNEDLPLSCDMIDEDIPNSEGLKMNSSSVKINNLCQEKDIILDEDMKDSQVELNDVTDMNESVEGKELVPDEEMADVEREEEMAELNESIEEPRMSDLNESLQEIVNKESTHGKSGSIEVNMEEEGIVVESMRVKEVKSGTEKETISKDSVSEIDMEKAASPMDVDSASYEENLERDDEVSTKLDSSQKADKSENAVNGKVNDKEFREDSESNKEESPSKKLNDQELDGLNKSVTTSIQNQCSEEENSDASKSDPDFADLSADEEKEDDEENYISKRKRKRQPFLKKRRENVIKIDNLEAEASSKSCDKKEKLKKKRTKSEDVNHPRFKVPLEKGWVRELVFRNKNLALQSRRADVYYYTPSGRKLRSTIELKKNLTQGLTMDNFTFAKESIGINDNLREIVRDARVRNGIIPSSQPSEGSEVGVSSRSKRDSASKMSSSSQPSITPEVMSDPRPPSPALVNDDNDDTKTDKLLEENFEIENELEEDYAVSSDYQEDSGDGGPNERLVRKSKCTLKCSKALNLLPTIVCSKCFLKYHPECEDIKTDDADEEDLSEIIEYVCNSCRLETKESFNALESNLSQLPPFPKLRPLVKFSNPLVPNVKVTVNTVDEDNIGNNESSSVEIEDNWESDSDISDSTSSESHFFDDIVIEKNDIEVEDNSENDNEHDEEVVNYVTESTAADLNNTRSKCIDKQIEGQVTGNEVEPDENDISNTITDDPCIDEEIEEQVTVNEVEPDEEVENNFTESATIDLNNAITEDPPRLQDGCIDKNKNKQNNNRTEQAEEQVTENEVELVENNFTESTAVDLNNRRMEDPTIDKQMEDLVIQLRKGKEHKERQLVEEGTQVENERENQEEYRSSYSGIPMEFSGEMYQSVEASDRIEQFLASSQYLEDYNILRSQIANNYNSSVGEVPVEVSTSGVLNNSAVTPFAQIILPGNPSIIAENIAEKSIPLALREPLITAPVDELTKDTVQESSSCDPLATNVFQENSPVKPYPYCQSNDLFVSNDKVRTALMNKLENTSTHDHTYPDVKKASSSKDKPAVKKARNMKGPCNCKLSETTKIFKCNSLTEQDRAFIYNKFWMINSWDKKKKFVTKLIEKRNTTDHPSISSNDSPEKMFDTGNIIYYLMKGGSRLRVCRKMFLNTLGIGDWSLSNWLKSLR